MANKVGSSSDIRKKLSYEYEMITTAHHESSHAIIALLTYMKVSNVGLDRQSIKDKRSNDSFGFTYYDAFYSDFDHIENQDLANYFKKAEIMISYAGMAGETVFYKNISGFNKLPLSLQYKSTDDLAEAAHIIKKYNLAPPGKKRYAYKKKVFRETKSILEYFWIDVKMLTHELLGKKRIYENDVKYFLTKKSRNKKFWKQHFKNIDFVFSSEESIATSFIFKNPIISIT